MRFVIQPAIPLRLARWAAMAALFLNAGIAAAGTLTGTVRNGTTGKPAAGVQVILIELQGTMQPVAQVRTDAQGQFHLENAALGAAPMLLRAVYRDLNYHQPVPVGATTADIEVYDPTDESSAISVSAHALILQPEGSHLTVGEEFSIQNATKPPVTYYRADGDFVFRMPPGAQLSAVDAADASGMPVIQAAMDKGRGEEAIAYPFRPGNDEVRVAYKLPYTNNRATLRLASPYAAARLAVLAPPSMQVSAEGFAPAGQAQGMNVYLRESVPANAPLTIAISGAAPPPAPGAADQGGDSSQNPSVNSRAPDAAADSGSATLTTMPARLDSLRWPLVAGFLLLLALGAAVLWKRRVFATAASEPSVASPALAHSPVEPSAAKAAGHAQAPRGGLEELKESLFRLEMRRQAGTLPEDEYARERAQIEAAIRKFIRG